MPFAWTKEHVKKTQWAKLVRQLPAHVKTYPVCVLRQEAGPARFCCLVLLQLFRGCSGTSDFTGKQIYLNVWVLFRKYSVVENKQCTRVVQKVQCNGKPTMYDGCSIRTVWWKTNNVQGLFNKYSVFFQGCFMSSVCLRVVQ